MYLYMYLYFPLRKSQDASDQEEKDDDDDGEAKEGTKAKVLQNAREFSSKIDETLPRQFFLLCWLC